MKIWGKSVSTEEIKKATYEELVSLINQWAILKACWNNGPAWFS